MTADEIGQILDNNAQIFQDQRNLIEGEMFSYLGEVGDLVKEAYEEGDPTDFDLSELEDFDDRWMDNVVPHILGNDERAHRISAFRKIGTQMSQDLKKRNYESASEVFEDAQQYLNQATGIISNGMDYGLGGAEPGELESYLNGALGSEADRFDVETISKASQGLDAITQAKIQESSGQQFSSALENTLNQLDKRDLYET